MNRPKLSETKIPKEISKKTGHTQYRIKTGKIVPNVSSVVGLIDKPGLVRGAFKLGLQGMNYREEWGFKRDVGSVTHDIIRCYFTKKKVDLSRWEDEKIELAEECFTLFLDHIEDMKVKPLLIEIPLVSEKYGFGGTPDFLGLIARKLILWDYKTGGSLWPDMIPKMAAYKHLLEENGQKVDKVILLNLNWQKDNVFSFELKKSLLDKGFKLFLHLLKALPLKEELWKIKLK